MARPGLAQAGGRQADLLGDVEDDRLGQLGASLVQAVVHGPETRLAAGPLGRFGGALRVGMGAGYGEMPEHKPQLFSEFIL